MAIAPNALIATTQGLRMAESLRGQAFEVYDGTEPLQAELAPVADRPLAETLLDNGLILRTDPEQRFWTALNHARAPVWRKQSELRPGDQILMPYQRYDCALDTGIFAMDDDFGGWGPSFSFLNDPYVWRLIGYGLARGYFPEKGGHFRVYANSYHHAALLRRFERSCREHGIDTVRTDRNRPLLMVLHPPFERWLCRLGLDGANVERRFVPPSLFAAPAWIREAVLQGFFSGEGEWHCHTRQHRLTPCTHTNDPTMAQAVLRLLWSVGVAAAVKARGEGPNARGSIFVRDIGRWQEQINFLPEYKRVPWVERGPEQTYRWDLIRPELVAYIFRILRGRASWQDLGKTHREYLTRLHRQGVGVRRFVLRRMCRAMGEPVPSWLDYHHARVDATRVVTERVLMDEPVSPGVVRPRYVSDFVLSRAAANAES